MNLIRPGKLKPGDTIGLVGTSGHSTSQTLESAAASLKELGFTVKLGESCKQKHGYFSGNDELRALDLNRMFADNSVNGVFAMRGGYGCARLLDLVDLRTVLRNPKFFCGYSDITFLHILFNQKCNLETYHTPMPTTELYKGLDDYSMDYYKRVLFDPKPLGEVHNPIGQPLETLNGGYAEGLLTGGNLSLVVSTLGTPAEIDCENKILFLEDIDEDIYRIDSMLCQLRNAGKLNDACGIILGGFTNCAAKKPDDALSLNQVFNELIVPTEKPAISNLALGHCMPTMSIPLGAPVSLDATKKRIVFM